MPLGTMPVAPMAAMCANGRPLTRNLTRIGPWVFYCETEVVQCLALHMYFGSFLAWPTGRTDARRYDGHSGAGAPISQAHTLLRSA